MVGKLKIGDHIAGRPTAFTPKLAEEICGMTGPVPTR